MTTRTTPTRAALLQARRLSDRVERGAALLRRKREALVRALMPLARPAAEARRAIAEIAAAAYRAELDAASDSRAKLAEIEARLQKLRSPFRSAETFWIEEIIDPRATRPLLCEFAALAAPLREPGPSMHRMRP
jgi:acetyl-CoA carboxylase carboxyltransferase component